MRRVGGHLRPSAGCRLKQVREMAVARVNQNHPFWGGQLTFFSDSDFLHEIRSRDERYDACCDNDLLHAGGDSGIENAGGT